MKVESVSVYDDFGAYIPTSLPANNNFQSLFEIAEYYRILLNNNGFSQALLFVDNWRYMLVTQTNFSVHYVQFFKQF